MNPNGVTGCPMQVLNTHVSPGKAGLLRNMTADLKDVWATRELEPAIHHYSYLPVGRNLNECRFYQWG